ncbi:AMIN domain-containing protein [bacterium]|nr:AMIN domain-containing protein [bacterium]
MHRFAIPLAACCALGADPTAQAAESPHVGRPQYDAVQRTLTLTGTGDRPQVRMIREPGQILYLELVGARYGARTWSINPNDGLVRRILVAQNRPGVVRIALRGVEELRLARAFSPHGSGWQLKLDIAPQKPPLAPPPARKPEQAIAPEHRRREDEPALIGSFRFDGRTGEIRLPLYRRPVSSGVFVDPHRPNVAFVELPAGYGGRVELVGRTRSLDPAHPLIDRILLAQNREGVVRLAVRAKQPFELQTRRRPVRDHWELVIKLVPVAMPAPTPTPLPMPTAMPALPVATIGANSEPTLTPSPSLSPCPSPVPPADHPGHRLQVPRPLSQTITMGYQSRNLQEDYATGGSVSRLSAIDAYGLTLEQQWQDAFSSRLALDRAAYRIVDDSLLGSHHDRTETQLKALAVWENSALKVRQRLAVGYQMRVVSVDSSFAAPQPSYMFSNSQLYHGPEVGDELVVPLTGPLDGLLDLQLQPYVFNALDTGVPELGPLYRLSVEPGLQASFGAASLRLSYQVDLLSRYGGPFQTFSGPSMRMAWRF